MEIEIIKKLIKENSTQQGELLQKALQGRRYYKRQTDIMFREKTSDKNNNPLRNADNRVNTNWHGLLVDQKASYLFTYPPTFDIGNKKANDMLNEVLGDDFPKTCKDLCVDASNTSCAVLHIWKDSTGKLEYAPIPVEQIIPVWDTGLKKKLRACFRKYDTLKDDGKIWTIYEYWTETECFAYEKETSKAIDESFREANIFAAYNVDENITEFTNTYKHNFGEVPFIFFYNNNIQENDLSLNKELIDVYEKVLSGFVNDVEDIQEIIFVLKNYGGTDLSTFKQKLKETGVIDMQSDMDEQTGLDTITINIPVEAKDKLLTLIEKLIYKFGQGVNPDLENYGNASGVALEYLYSLLELKSGLMETEFKPAFAKFIRLICKQLNIPCKKIIQTWTRNKIRNDTETAAIAVQSKGIISDKTILKNHPWVEDTEQEIKELEKQQEKEDIFSGYSLIEQQAENLNNRGSYEKETGVNNEQQ